MSSKSVCLGSVLAVLLPVGVADEQEPRGSITVSLLKSQDTASIQISDTGHGISEGAKTRKFDSFFSTKPTGIGLGLSIVRTLVESHGGPVWAEKRPGGGATFHVDLQAYKMPRREAA